MPRIVVNPEELRRTSSSMKVNSENIYTLATQLRGAANCLDWEVHATTNIDSRVNAACKQARDVAAQLMELSQFLSRKAQDFEDTDRQCAEGLQVLDGTIKQFTAPIQTMKILGLAKVMRPMKNMKINPLARFPTYSEQASYGLAGKPHTGVDMRPDPYEKDCPVSSIGPGVVQKIGYSESYGNYVIIEHTKPDGTSIFSRYAHLQSKPKLTVGQWVGTEDNNATIGTMGNTGKSFGEHLHLEVWTENEKGSKTYENPENYLYGDEYFKLPSTGIPFDVLPLTNIL